MSTQSSGTLDSTRVSLTKSNTLFGDRSDGTNGTKFYLCVNFDAKRSKSNQTLNEKKAASRSSVPGQ